MKAGQRVAVTAKQLNGRTGPGLNYAAKVQRATGYDFTVSKVSADGKWARATTYWYATSYLKVLVADPDLRSAKAAVAASRRWTTCKVGMCLYTVQEWFSGRHAIGWAEAAWDASKHKHPGEKTPPPGVPCYWHNPRSKYGHIAISVGKGRVRSTDWPTRGKVGETSIDNLTKTWGLRYLGYASDMAPEGLIPGIGD